MSAVEQWHTKTQCCGTKMDGPVARDWFSVPGLKKEVGSGDGS